MLLWPHTVMQRSLVYSLLTCWCLNCRGVLALGSVVEERLNEHPLCALTCWGCGGIFCHWSAVHPVTASPKNIICTRKTPFFALSSDCSLSILNNNTSSLLINNSVWRLIQINLGSHCIKHFRKKKTHKSSGCLWKAISSMPGSLITSWPWHSGSHLF